MEGVNYRWRHTKAHEYLGAAAGLSTAAKEKLRGTMWSITCTSINAPGREGSQLGGADTPRPAALPWDVSSNFDISMLTDGGRTVLKRVIQWAAEGSGGGAVCGDASCDPGEECTCAADCGAPAAFEQPGVTCDDGLDNDCDGLTDCDDANCLSDPACAVCDNGTCEAGEDCNSCGADCPGKSNGPAWGRYCCGNGVAESAEGDGSICDGNY